MLHLDFGLLDVVRTVAHLEGWDEDECVDQIRDWLAS
jgi:hypothetical protein